MFDRLLAAHLFGSVVFADENFTLPELMLLEIFVCENFYEGL